VRLFADQTIKPSFGKYYEVFMQALSLLITLFFFVTATAFGDSPKDYYTEGVAKAKKGDFDGALSDLDKAIELNPNLVAPYFARGLARQSKSDFKGALADYSKAIQLRPDYSPAYDSRGSLKAAQGDLGGAIADFDKSIEINSTNVRAYSNRCLAKFGKGDLGERGQLI
jgi:tetratricopeptide (TPR) repeat protein